MEKINKIGLIHQGNDEAYGLIFVAGELKKQNQNFEWFDAEEKDVIEKIVLSKPDFLFFSPLTTFFEDAINLSKRVKANLPDIISVFGGPHVFASPETIKMEGVDIIVRGPIYGTVEKIFNSLGKEILLGTPVPVSEMMPEREEYYNTIPRIANRERKDIMSHFGCVYNCSYCSTSNTRKFYGVETYNRYCLTRRPIENMIKEAKIFLKYNTKEISLEDDDVLYGNADEWLEEFSSLWKKEINLPIFANVSPLTVIKSSDKTLKILSELVASVQMGVQVVNPESLKLFNRSVHDRETVKSAYEKLSSFGIPVKMEFIMGLPIENPVKDAIDSIKFAQELNAQFVAAFPLMLYPGTDLSRYCEERGIKLNEECKSEWHTGVGSIKFDKLTDRRIKNLTKMATFFVKYKVSERWIMALIDMEITEDASRKLAECKYLESLIFRIGPEIEKDFDNILSKMDFKY
jgi:radical SAM superfamily enzyme YgiQ (UPF0313 family)